MIVILADAAEADLEAIADHIAEHNPSRAVTFIRELREQCLGLADMPRAFALVPGRERDGIRRRVFGRYLIFYRTEATRIVILHILNAAMDYEALLFPD